MPITIKTNQISVKNPTTGVFESSEMFIPNINNLLDEKQDAPENAGTSGQVLGLDNNGDPEWVNQPNVPVTDVQVNGTSVLSQGVANVPVGDGSNFGALKTDTSATIKAGSTAQRAITPYRQHESTFYGLAKAAGADMASSSNPVGTYTDDAKTAIKTMLGVTDDISQLNSALTAKQDAPASGAAAGKVLGLALVDGKLVPVWDGFPVSDVQIDGTSILQNGVANVPIGDYSTYGVIKVQQYGGLQFGSTNMLKTDPASESSIKTGTEGSRPIIPSRQHAATFYGLAKAAGTDMASLSSVTVGQYPEAQRIAIQKMLGIYQAPWELIRKDTVTNETKADIEITVDSNGQPFELTDIRLMISLPQQETEAKVEDFGRVRCYYSGNNDDILYTGVTTIAAGTVGKGAQVWIEQHDGMIERYYTAYYASGSNVMQQLNNAFAPISSSHWELATKSYYKVKICAVTGKCKYYLFGKRKWT